MSFNRISAAEAASLIKHGYNIGLSGFTPAGTAKAVTAELAKIAEAEHAKGNPFQVGIFTGASTGESCDGVLARAKAIRYRAPYTTLVGMKTSTSPYGRDVHLHGYPLKMADIAAQLEGTAYVTRQSVQSVPAIRKAKKAIRKAFENSMAGKGSNLVEIVSTCNSGWKMSPAKSNEWMVENMFPFYPLGDLKDK